MCVCVCFAVKSQAPDKAPASNGSSFNQLLGIKGAAQESVSHASFIYFHFLLGLRVNICVCMV